MSTCCFSVVAFGWVFFGGLVPIFPLSSVEDITNTPLPVGSRLVYADYMNPISPRVTAIVDLPPGAATSFASSPRFQYRSTKRGINEEVAPDDPAFPPSWHTERIQRFIAMSGGELGGDGAVVGVVDLDRPERPRLYLIWAHQ